MTIGSQAEAFGSAVAGTSIALEGPFNLSLSGTFVATVQLQRSFDAGSTWLVVKSYTAVAEEVGDAGDEKGVLHRLECTAYTSGTVVGRLSR